MKKVTFKCESGDSIIDNPYVYTMQFDFDGLTFDEFLEEVKKFAILLGYASETVDDYFPMNDGH